MLYTSCFTNGNNSLMKGGITSDACQEHRSFNVQMSVRGLPASFNYVVLAVGQDPGRTEKREILKQELQLLRS